MSKDEGQMAVGFIGELLGKIQTEMSDEIAEFEENLQRDPVLFTETYAHWIDFFYHDCSNYKKVLTYSHALPTIKKQLFRYAEDQVFEIRQCIYAFNGIAGSLEQTGQIEDAIACYQEGIQICELIYSRDKSVWWYDYEMALSGLYLAYLNEGMLEAALPLIHQCIGLYEQHHSDPARTWITDEYRVRYEDILYILEKLGDVDGVSHYSKKAKALFQ